MMRAAGWGTLFLVSGPNGAGKNAIMREVRHRMAVKDGIVFPMRTITRPGGHGGEVHISVTPAQFDRLRREGRFALCWSTGGCNYAISATIDGFLAQGSDVVVNVAPQVVAAARQHYGRVAVLWVDAPEDLRRRRLEARGRETPAEIEARLAEDRLSLVDEECTIVENDGDFDKATARFLAALARLRRAPSEVATQNQLSEDSFR